MKSLLIILLLIQISFAQVPLTTNTSTNFTGSGVCAICHISNGSVLTWNNNDVAPVTHWRSAMMGNSTKDPLWRAMVSAEVIAHPHLQTAIESRCTNCHAPMGYSQAIINGQSDYSIAEMDTSDLAKDGVSCSSCHQIENLNFGNNSSFSGGYEIGLNKIIYGPYQSPFPGPMINNIGFTPAFSGHVNDSELCATCHTLYTPYVDNSGSIGGTFPEQVPYLEWKNSDYPGQAIECQTCHMPQIFDPMDISAMPTWHTTTHSPYWQHHFVGGNVFMQTLLRDHLDTLGLSASTANFDSTINRTLKQLTQNTVNLQLNTAILNDSLNIELEIENLSGHKLPTGIPLRRMWVHLSIKNQVGQTVFESGDWDNNFEISNLDDEFEQHYDVITNQDQVQIYEGIMKDVDDSVTYRLLRASAFAKDNRIPPKGFNTSHSSYDSIRIVGNAETDDNFNRDNSIEGSGKDLITYKIPVANNTEYTIEAEVCYQTVMPRFLQHLFEYSSLEIDLFENLYIQQDNSPVILKSITQNVILTNTTQDEINQPLEFNLSQNYPNPFNNKTKISFTVPDTENIYINLYNTQGKIIKTYTNTVNTGTHTYFWDGTDNFSNVVSTGIYYYEIIAGNYSEVKKCLLIK